MKKYLYILIPALLLAVSCQEEPIGSVPVDSVAPGAVTDVNVENVPGGANITYTLPDDEDLLYVQAFYTLENGTPANVMSSMYSDTLKIRGYANPADYPVQIVAYDRSGNASATVDATITPLRSPIYDVLESLVVKEAFGGVSLVWENNTKAAVAVTLMKKVSTLYEDIVTYYSDAPTAKQNARGMAAEKTDFAIYIKDKWDNSTDTLHTTLTPLYEEQFKAKVFKKYAMTGDSDISYGWDLSYALDGITTDPWGWFSKPTVEGGNWPARFTVTADKQTMLSRVRIIQRHPEMWENGNPKKFEVWGSNNPPSDGSFDNWELIKTFTSVKPSGLPSGEYSDEDKYIAENGEDFEFDADKLKAYKYYRFNFLENWGGDNTFLNLYEIFFYGKYAQ